MSTVRFTEEFKLEAVKRVTEHKRPIACMPGSSATSGLPNNGNQRRTTPPNCADYAPR